MTDVTNSLEDRLATLRSRIDRQLQAHSKPAPGPQPKYESFTAETISGNWVSTEVYLLYLAWKLVQGGRVVVREIGRAFGVLFKSIIASYGRSNQHEL